MTATTPESSRRTRADRSLPCSFPSIAIIVRHVTWLEVDP